MYSFTIVQHLYLYRSNRIESNRVKHWNSGYDQCLGHRVRRTTSRTDSSGVDGEAEAEKVHAGLHVGHTRGVERQRRQEQCERVDAERVGPVARPQTRQAASAAAPLPPPVATCAPLALPATAAAAAAIAVAGGRRSLGVRRTPSHQPHYAKKGRRQVNRTY